jgi:hypothetical protein
MSPALQQLVTAIESVMNKQAKKSGKGFRLPCPAHNGKDFNLYLADGQKKIMIKCHSHQCDPKEVLAAVGLGLSDIYYENTFSTSGEHKAHLSHQQNYRIKKELGFELLILQLWLSDSEKGEIPTAGSTDFKRVNLALTRVDTATNHFLKVGAL